MLLPPEGTPGGTTGHRVARPPNGVDAGAAIRSENNWLFVLFDDHLREMESSSLDDGPSLK